MQTLYIKDAPLKMAPKDMPMPQGSPGQKSTKTGQSLGMTMHLCLQGAILLASVAAIAAQETSPAPDPYTANPFLGRFEPKHAAPRCCRGEACLTHRQTGRYAFVTSVRSSAYLVGLQELACSLALSNPNVSLIVMGVTGDLAPDEVAQIERIAEYRLVEDIVQENTRNARFGLNWVKLRAWAWEEYEAVIMLDVDMVVLGSLMHLFRLPTDFAWAPYQGHTGWDWNRGGFMMLRPCAAVFASMMAHMRSDERLHFVEDHAEQSFIDWYWKYTGFHLPMSYNLNFKFLTDGLTPGGEAPLVLHFANHKPFKAGPGDEEWPYLCWQPQQHLARLKNEQTAAALAHDRRLKQL